MQTEIIQRPRLVIAIVEGQYVGVAAKVPDRPDAMAEAQALREAMSQRQCVESLTDVLPA